MGPTCVGIQKKIQIGLFVGLGLIAGLPTVTWAECSAQSLDRVALHAEKIALQMEASEPMAPLMPDLFEFVRALRQYRAIDAAFHPSSPSPTFEEDPFLKRLRLFHSRLVTHDLVQKDFKSARVQLLNAIESLGRSMNTHFEKISQIDSSFFESWYVFQVECETSIRLKNVELSPSNLPRTFTLACGDDLFMGLIAELVKFKTLLQEQREFATAFVARKSMRLPGESLSSSQVLTLNLLDADLQEMDGIESNLTWAFESLQVALKYENSDLTRPVQAGYLRTAVDLMGVSEPLKNLSRHSWVQANSHRFFDLYENYEAACLPPPRPLRPRIQLKSTERVCVPSDVPPTPVKQRPMLSGV